MCYGVGEEHRINLINKLKYSKGSRLCYIKIQDIVEGKDAVTDNKNA